MRCSSPQGVLCCGPIHCMGESEDRLQWENSQADGLCSNSFHQQVTGSEGRGSFLPSVTVGSSPNIAGTAPI